MKNIKLSLLTFILFTFTYSLNSCKKEGDSKTTTTEKQTENKFGTVNLTVTGAIEKSFSGMCDFQSYSFANMWEIDGHDGKSVNGQNTQSFSISITETGEDASKPDVGEYDIGPLLDAPYQFSLIHIIDNDFESSVEYGTLLFEEDVGTLTISSSSEKEVKGSFNLTASEIVDDEMGLPTRGPEVKIKGEFTAYPVIR